MFSPINKGLGKKLEGYNSKIFKTLEERINEKLSDSLDFDYSTVSEKITSIDEFEKEIYSRFLNKEWLFYRGESVYRKERRLIPTIFRDTRTLFDNSSYGNELGIVHINADYIFNYYSSMGSFVDLFRRTMGEADSKHLYDICAFAQHYCNVSPLIDFSKSLYPALSFALKGRETYDKDIVIYVLELKNISDYTSDINIANQWLENLNIYAGCFDEETIINSIREAIETRRFPQANDYLKNHLKRLGTKPAPNPKLIDIPINTRMRFQQGVFLFLNDFQIFNSTYLTKSVRDRFIINRYIIDKSICPRLKRIIEENAPWYSYKYLTDVESAFKVAIQK